MNRHDTSNGKQTEDEDQDLVSFVLSVAIFELNKKFFFLFYLVKGFGECIQFVCFRFFFLFLCFKKPSVEVKRTTTKTRKPVIFWHALFYAYKGKFIAGGLMKLVHDLFQFSGPMILKYNNSFFF